MMSGLQRIWKLLTFIIGTIFFRGVATDRRALGARVLEGSQFGFFLIL